jgi:hypothetical protein
MDRHDSAATSDVGSIAARVAYGAGAGMSRGLELYIV